jgi:hypothetical protein
MAAPLVACWDRSAVVNSVERSVDSKDKTSAELTAGRWVERLVEPSVARWVVTTVAHSAALKARGSADYSGEQTNDYSDATMAKRSVEH